MRMPAVHYPTNPVPLPKGAGRVHNRHASYMQLVYMTNTQLVYMELSSTGVHNTSAHGVHEEQPP
jgi:hypothetical protein